MKKDTYLSDGIRLGFANKPVKRWPTYGGDFLDRGSVVTASEVGNCLRRLWYSKNLPAEVSAPDLGEPWMGMAERGHTAEAWVVEMLTLAGFIDRDADVELMYAGDQQVSFKVGNLSGTPDGVLVDRVAREAEVVDFKSISPRFNKANLPKAGHLSQLIANGYVVEKSLDIPVTGIRIVYVNADDYADIREFYQEFGINDPTVEATVERADTVMTANSAEELTPEGMYNGGCRFCEFKEQCSAAVEEESIRRDRERSRKAAAKAAFK